MQIEQNKDIELQNSNLLSNSFGIAVYASWKFEKENMESCLKEDRHFLGTSSFCSIRVTGDRENICASLTIGVE